MIVRAHNLSPVVEASAKQKDTGLGGWEVILAVFFILELYFGLWLS